jgi:YhcH/YjgK/YiaL family protein
MIIDHLDHADMYAGMNKRIALALSYLAGNDFSTIEPGRYELDGANVYAMVQQYDTKTREAGKWEAHRQYIDVQFVAQGEELMGYAPLDRLKAGPYHEDGDYLLLEGEGEFMLMRPGSFVILAPQDAHMPGMAVHAPRPVRKVVVKVKID